MNDAYRTFDRASWAALRAATPMTLAERDLDALRGINERLDLEEVVDVYLPLSRLLNLYVTATQSLFRVADAFLGQPTAKVPYVIGVAGSVAVGKSTSSRILQALLSRWPDHPRVDLVTTDGFLLPNQVLMERGLVDRKGFPESYDTARLVAFLAELKGGAEEVAAPVYSHAAYDIVPGETQVVHRPDVVILEGLNVLQSGHAQTFVSDFFDFSIYVDAAEEDILEWYVERFLTLQMTSFRDQASAFHEYAGLDDHSARGLARQFWDTINHPNLVEHILPTRERADLILHKAADHRVDGVRLRRI
jgi:type I pantothenate kinase